MKNNQKSNSPKSPAQRRLQIEQMRNALANDSPLDPLMIFHEHIAAQAIEDEIRRFVDQEEISDRTGSSGQVPILGEKEALRLIAADEAFLSVDGLAITPPDAAEISLVSDDTPQPNHKMITPALARHRQLRLKQFPPLWLFCHLKLIDLTFVPITKSDLNGGHSFRSQQYAEHWQLTERGCQIWENAGLEVDETALPIARRKVIGITKLTVEKKNLTTVEYEWKIEPNEISTHLLVGTHKFQTLPADLKESIIRSKTLLSLPQIFARKRAGDARLEYYDGSWQITKIAGYDVDSRKL